MANLDAGFCNGSLRVTAADNGLATISRDVCQGLRNFDSAVLAAIDFEHADRAVPNDSAGALDGIGEELNRAGANVDSCITKRGRKGSYYSKYHAAKFNQMDEEIRTFDHVNAETQKHGH